MLGLPVLGPLTRHVLVLSRRVLNAISKANSFLDPVKQLLLRLELFLIREIDAYAAWGKAKQESMGKAVIRLTESIHSNDDADKSEGWLKKSSHIHVDEPRELTKRRCSRP